MTERKLKSLILFIFESIAIQNRRTLNQDFVEQFNNFIYEQYAKDKESLDVIFDIDLLGEFIEGKYDILNLSQMIQLIYRYKELENYAKLVEEIGIADDKKINDLALLFTKYYQEIIELSNIDDSIKHKYQGYIRILQ